MTSRQPQSDREKEEKGKGAKMGGVGGAALGAGSAIALRCGMRQGVHTEGDISRFP